MQGILDRQVHITIATQQSTVHPLLAFCYSSYDSENFPLYISKAPGPHAAQFATMRTILGFIPLASMWLSVRRQTRRPDKPSSQRYYSEYTCTFRPTTTLYRCGLEYSDSRQPGHH